MVTLLTRNTLQELQESQREHEDAQQQVEALEHELARMLAKGDCVMS